MEENEKKIARDCCGHEGGECGHDDCCGHDACCGRGCDGCKHEQGAEANSASELNNSPSVPFGAEDVVIGTDTDDQLHAVDHLAETLQQLTESLHIARLQPESVSLLNDVINLTSDTAVEFYKLAGALEEFKRQYKENTDMWKQFAERANKMLTETNNALKDSEGTRSYLEEKNKHLEEELKKKSTDLTWTELSLTKANEKLEAIGLIVKM